MSSSDLAKSVLVRLLSCLLGVTISSTSIMLVSVSTRSDASSTIDMGSDTAREPETLTGVLKREPGPRLGLAGACPAFRERREGGKGEGENIAMVQEQTRFDVPNRSRL